MKIGFLVVSCVECSFVCLSLIKRHSRSIGLLFPSSPLYQKGGRGEGKETFLDAECIEIDGRGRLKQRPTSIPSPESSPFQSMKEGEEGEGNKERQRCCSVDSGLPPNKYRFSFSVERGAVISFGGYFGYG